MALHGGAHSACNPRTKNSPRSSLKHGNVLDHRVSPHGSLDRRGADKPATRIFESPADAAPQGKIDELVFARLEQAGIQPASVCSDAVFVRRVYLDVIGTLPTAKEAREFLRDQDPDKRRRPDRSPAGTRRVRGLLGDEVERSAAGQGRVSHQSVAERGPGVPPLDSDQHQGEPAVRPFRPRDAHGQRQQFPRRPSQLLPRRSKQDSGGHRPSRGLDVHGNAGRQVAERPVGGHGGVLFADQLQVHGGVERGNRLVRSGQGSRPRRPAACRGRFSGWDARPGCPRTGSAAGLRRLAD